MNQTQLPSEIQPGHIRPRAQAPTPDVATKEVVGMEGEMHTIPKDMLRVDHTYQREDINQSLVRRIRRSWDPGAAHALLVSERRDGYFYILDGQHRWLAGRQIEQVTHFHCKVLRGLSLEAEALKFRKVNERRIAVSALSKHKAGSVSGTEHDMWLDDLLRRHGVVLVTANNGNTDALLSIRCVGLVRRISQSQKERVAFERLLPLLIELTGRSIIAEILIAGLVYLECHLPHDASLTQANWRKRLIAIEADRLVRVAKSCAASFARGGARIWALGMLEEINKGRKNRLVMETVD